MSFINVKYFESFDNLGSFESLDLFPYVDLFKSCEMVGSYK